MARDRRDDKTMSLLDWEPPVVNLNISENIVGNGDLSNQISRTISHALRETSLDREEIAIKMSEYLGRKISRDILDKWSSEASEGNRIPFDAFIALVEATGINDLLGFAPEIFGFVVVSERYSKILEYHEVKEHRRKSQLHDAQMELREASLLEQIRGG